MRFHIESNRRCSLVPPRAASVHARCYRLQSLPVTIRFLGGLPRKPSPLPNTLPPPACHAISLATLPSQLIQTTLYSQRSPIFSRLVFSTPPFFLPSLITRDSCAMFCCVMVSQSQSVALILIQRSHSVSLCRRFLGFVSVFLLCLSSSYFSLSAASIYRLHSARSCHFAHVVDCGRRQPRSFHCVTSLVPVISSYALLCGFYLSSHGNFEAGRPAARRRGWLPNGKRLFQFEVVSCIKSSACHSDCSCSFIFLHN